MSKQVSSSTMGHFKSSRNRQAGNFPLVIDGDTVKLRIQAEREFTSNKVHIDWVRFTCRLKNAPTPLADVLFPKFSANQQLLEDRESIASCQYFKESDFLPASQDVDESRQILWRAERQRVQKSLDDLDESGFIAAAQAHELAVRVSKALGPDFVVDPEYRKGMDFYKHRWSILLNGTECGWVGFLSSSESKRQSAQNETIHVNLHGTACTFANPGWNMTIADIVDETESELTRSDLALDFFDGFEKTIEQITEDYRSGACNVGGRQPCSNRQGAWDNGHDRSFYIGSRSVGKQTNVYEKGDQLYGHLANSEWLRFELRYGNKKRELSSDILRRPDDFFAGASEWHRSVLLSAKAVASAEPVPCTPRLQIQTVEAECSRSIRWLVQTAAATLKVAITHLDPHDLFELIGNAKLPSRLRKFSGSQIESCFKPAIKTVASFPALILDAGTTATYSLSSAGSSPTVLLAA